MIPGEHDPTGYCVFFKDPVWGLPMKAEDMRRGTKIGISEGNLVGACGPEGIAWTEMKKSE